jgi:kynurenine formamidase
VIAATVLEQALHGLGLPDNLVTEIEGRLRSPQHLLGKMCGVMFPPLFGCRTNAELCRVRGWDKNLPSRLLGALPKRPWLKRLRIKPFFTRGILLDVLSLKGGERLPMGYVITVEDIKQTLTKQGIKEPGEGDVVLFRTGYIKLWKKDNAEFNKGCTGPGETAARWLVERKIACMGGDTWPVEAVPGEHKDRPFACHVILIAMNGIFIIENQNLEELAQDRVYEFAWSFNPLPLVGGTGSPGNSVAIA